MAFGLHTASPSELKQRLEAERRGEPFLVYRDGDGAQCIFALEAGARLTVGRRPENDLALCFDQKRIGRPRGVRARRRGVDDRRRRPLNGS